MKIVQTKYLQFLIVAIAIISFCVVGCGTENEVEHQNAVTAPDTQEVATEPEDEVYESASNVPGTNIALYPGAQIVFEDEVLLVYSTDASLEDLYDFYNEYPDLRGVHISRTADGFFMETELARMGRSSLGAEDYEEIIQDEKSKSGNLMDVVAMKVDSDEITKLLSDEAVSNLPRDGIALRFRFFLD